MAFLRGVTQPHKGLVLIGNRICLRAPQMSDYEQWAALRSASEAFLKPWEPSWTAGELSRYSFRNRIRFYSRGAREGSSHAFFLVSRTTDQLLGGLTLSNVRHGVIGSCSLGYWVGGTYARQGYMTEAVRTVLPFVFKTLRLHRLEAACLPENIASVGLLKKCGFSQEGVARKYLQINGLWQDHLLFALLDEDY